MYVVRRPFRNYNKMLTSGTVVEPKDVKHFKSRLRDHDIIIVSDADFDKWNDYFQKKFGVEIHVPDEAGCDACQIHFGDDAGQNDEGQNDEGQNDAGQNDEGQNDAGQNDAGQNDAGQNDGVNVEPVKPQVAKVVVKLN